jgi:putative addiction module killer protein
MMADGPKELRIYSTADGKKPFQDWIESLTDGEAKARILVRLERVRLGNLGDCKSVGEGVYELRIKIGPGYRVYFGRDGRVFVILLCGGSKATQRKDIANGKAYWQDYRSRKDAKKRTI